MSSLLVVIPNYVISDVEVSGLAIRYLEICHALSNTVHCTIVAKVSPYQYTEKRYNVNVIDYSKCMIENLIDMNDYVMFSDLANVELIKYCKKKRKKIICENQVPIEHMYYNEIRNSNNRNKVYHNIIEDYKNQIKYSDYFIVRSVVEYRQLISNLFLLEKIKINNYFENDMPPIFYIPIGYSVASVRLFNQTYRNKFVLAWNGGIWDFLDVSWLSSIALPKNVEIQFMYGNKRNNEIISSDNQVKILNIEYNYRDEYMKSVDAFICIGKMLPENALCHRLRLRDVF